MKKLVIIIIGLLLIVGPSMYHDANDKYVQIEGTVIAKSDEITSHYKSTKVTTDYILAIHPNDSTKYIDFDHEVSLATYIKYNVGDKISCKTEKYYIMKNPEWYDNKSLLCIIYIGIMLFGIILVIIGCLPMD